MKLLLTILLATPALFGQGPFERGVALYDRGEFRAAIAEFEQAASVQATAARAYMRIARSWVKLGDVDRAFSFLEKSAASGFSFVQVLDGERDLEPLRGDRRFAAIAAKVRDNAFPCLGRPERRVFDFWIGEWTVVATGTGQVNGTSRIERITGGCGLLEHWVDSGGHDGKSVNFLNAGSGKWEQHWVSDNGTTTLYVGEFREGAMQFEGTTARLDGGTAPVRMRFTPIGGTVRQEGWISNDGGRTWVVTFDLTYRRN